MPNIENAEEFVVNINNVEGEDIARIDGYYENMTVGNAEQLVSSVYVEDKEPYNFRTSGGSADIGNRLTEKIIGGSLVWNQIQASTASRTHNGITYTYSSGKLTVQGTATANSLWVGAQQAVQWNWRANHVYLIDVGNDAYSGTSSKQWRIPKTSGGSTSIQINSHMQFIKEIADFVGYLTFAISNGQTVDPAEEYYPQVFDLTQMFGETIANYVYSLETATAGAGAAWFKNLFPKLYYAYNAGEIMSVKAASHDTVGFNQWDEVWENGEIYASNGQNANSTSCWRSKNYIRVIPNTAYYAFSPTSTNKSFRARFYDADKNYIGYSPKSGVTYTDSVFVTPDNAHYMRFAPSVADIPNHDICINLSWSGYRDGEYEEYKKRTYPLDTSLELRGIPKLDSANKLYYDGDTYESDGTVTRKYGIVDLGTLNWSLDSRYTNTQFYSALSDAKSSPDGNMICAKYFDVARGVWGDNVDKTICVTRGTPYVLIVDSSYSDSATFKAAMSGVYMVYELAEPTTETAEPFQSPQIVDDFGTEEYVDYGVQQNERDVAIPVGHDSQYMNNLRDKLQRMPEVPSANGTYIVQYEDGEMSYISYIAPTELPTNPSTDGSYHLVCTVADGQASYTWESNT